MALPFSNRISEVYVLTAGQTGPFTPSPAWPLYDATDLLVLRRRDGTVVELALGVDFTVTGAGVASSGFSLTLLAAALEDDELLLAGARDVARITTYTAERSVTPTFLNLDLNIVYAQLQEMQREVARAFKSDRFDADVFDVENRRLRNVGTAIAPTDAVNLGQIQDAFDTATATATAAADAAAAAQLAAEAAQGAAEGHDVDATAAAAAAAASAAAASAFVDRLPLTPQDFGAVANDTTDDGPALQTWWNECVAQKRKGWLAGKYYSAQQLSFDMANWQVGACVEGDNCITSKIRFGSGVAAPNLFIGSTVNQGVFFARFEKFSVEGLVNGVMLRLGQSSFGDAFNHCHFDLIVGNNSSGSNNVACEINYCVFGHIKIVSGCHGKADPGCALDLRQAVFNHFWGGVGNADIGLRLGGNTNCNSFHNFDHEELNTGIDLNAGNLNTWYNPCFSINTNYAIDATAGANNVFLNPSIAAVGATFGGSVGVTVQVGSKWSSSATPTFEGISSTADFTAAFNQPHASNGNRAIVSLRKNNVAQQTIGADTAATYYERSGTGPQAFYINGALQWAIRNGYVEAINDIRTAADGSDERSLLSRAAARKFSGEIIAASAVASAALTGSTAEATFATIPLLAGLLGPNGFLELLTLWSFTGTGGNWTAIARLGSTGGTAFLSAASTSALKTARYETMIMNRNNQASQVGAHSNFAGLGASAGSLITSAVDTSLATNLYIRGVLANAADSLVLEAYVVRATYRN